MFAIEVIRKSVLFTPLEPKKKKVIRARFDNAPRWVLIGFTSSAQAVTITKNKAGRSTLLSSLGALVSWY